MLRIISLRCQPVAGINDAVVPSSMVLEIPGAAERRGRSKAGKTVFPLMVQD